MTDPQSKASSSEDGGDYVGEELELFKDAIRWKRYVALQLAPFVAGDVLDVGAGLGENAKHIRGDIQSWTCLEPDASFVATMQRKIAAGELPSYCRATRGTLATLPTDATFDCIVYLDVLEHIKDDRAELAAAAKRLRPGGRLVVLVPAHQFLYSEFDAAIGHYRRYDRKQLLSVASGNLQVVRARYLDSCGLTLSICNRYLLRKSTPSAANIALWDSLFVRLSKISDIMTGYGLGKSVLAVWRKGADTDD